ALRHSPPLLRIARFEGTTTLRQLLRAPRRVDDITLTGFEVAIPPSRAPGQPRFPRRDGRPRDRIPEPVSTSEPSPPVEVPPAPTNPSPVVIRHLRANGMVLVVLPRERTKLPRRFVLHELELQDVAADRAMSFKAVVDNPVPRGRIETRGTFGPWQSATPGHTPLAAAYRANQVDLNTIRGIAGLVRTEGRFSGVLERIEATGTTSSQDFQLDAADRPMPLRTTFTVIVDGTNGNTWIAPATAHLGKATAILAKGGIVKAEDRRGRTVDLGMRIDGGRVEDVLALAVHTDEPIMKGLIDLSGTLLIPPGEGRVVQRMKLDGRFALRQAAFTSDTVQARIDELSRRARGKPQAHDIANVVSAFQGRYKMSGGVLSFPSLSFRVEGARVDMAGRYTVLTQALEFDGRIRMDAGVSQMVGGKKRFLLKVIDPLFRRNGATEFPIRIRGTARKPQFGVDVKTTLKRALLPGR
ncbi:MAG: hypothetical protein ACR2LU_02360, partial [Luteitalea sp.]